jgi:hypothetical protein
VTWSTDTFRSAIISSRFRKLRQNRRYQRTQRRIISASKCRPLNGAGRDRCMNRQRIRLPHPALKHFQGTCIKSGVGCRRAVVFRHRCGR